MKRVSVPVYLILALLVELSCFSTSAQEKVIKKVAPIGTASLDGKSLYQEYCAVCHGTQAKGGGPAAPALKQSPSDLTQIARQNNGHFPDQKILAIIKGEQAVAAHGNQEMPTWGKTFSDMSTNLNVSQGRLHALVDYLQSIQVK
jgi:mono/diheme cytochrome c family protein